MKTLTINKMEKIQGGMPCWAAKLAVVAAGISFTFLTAGWGSLIMGLLGLSFAEWGYLESCFPQLLSE